MLSSSVESDLLDALAGFSLCENNFLLLLLLNRQEFPVKSLWGWNAEFVQFSTPFWDFCAEPGFDRSPGWSWPSLPPKLLHCWSIEGKPFQVSRWVRNHLKLKRCIAPDQPLYPSRITSWDRERERERAFAHFFKFKASQLPLTLLTVKWARPSHTTSSMSSRLLAHGKQGWKLVAAYQKCTARAQKPISRGLVPLQSRLSFHKRAFTQMTQI